jgi:light-regulated signal transduction histidine kinase (bacteriophytochrome)
VPTTVPQHPINNPAISRKIVQRSSAQLPLPQQGGQRVELTREEYYEIVDQFAHDVRSPHCVISEYAALISEGLLDKPGETGDALAVIRNRTAELQLEVDALLLVAKLCGRKIDIDCHLCDATALVHESVSRLEESFDRRGVELEICIQPDLHFYGDANLVRTTLVNLLWCVLRAVSTSTTMRVSVDLDEEDRVRFCIAGSAIKRFEICPRGLAAQARVAIDGRRHHRKRIDIALGVAWELARLMRGDLTCRDDSIELPTIELLLPAGEPLNECVTKGR